MKKCKEERSIRRKERKREDINLDLKDRSFVIAPANDGSLPLFPSQHF